MNDTPDVLPMTLPASADDWEAPLTSLLEELSATQTELLGVLRRKREHIVAADREALLALQPEEERVAERLAACLRRREGLLDAARQQGLPGDNLRTLAGALPAHRALRPKVRSAQSQARLVRHESLTNWVLVQRTLLHLSQMIEIVACGGRSAPTYDKGGKSAAGGVLMDRAV